MLSPDELSDRFQQSWAPFWAIAVSIVRDREAAHDVVQEAAMIALGKASEFDAGTSFAAWAGQIVRYVALNHRRRANRDRATPTDPHEMQAASRVEGPVAAAPTLSPRLAAALEVLDEVPRTCLIMRAVLEMTYPQISEALGIPEGTAMSHVFRSRKALREALGESGREALA